LHLVEGVERAGGGCSRDCADLLLGLAFTGVRKGEASQIEWRDLDFETGEIVEKASAASGWVAAIS
jgi:integrase